MEIICNYCSYCIAALPMSDGRKIAGQIKLKWKVKKKTFKE